FEAIMILDTLQAVATQLLSRGLLYTQPSLFWTAVALLRCDNEAIFGRALALLNNIRGLPYLFESHSRARAGTSKPEFGLDDGSFARLAPSGSMFDVAGAAAGSRADDAAAEADPDQGGSSAASATRLPEDFWTFCDKWSPSLL